MYGIILRLQHTGKAPGNLIIPDTDAQAVQTKNRPGPLYIHRLATVDLVYTDMVALSYNQGSIRGFLTGLYITAEFIITPEFQALVQGTILRTAVDHDYTATLLDVLIAVTNTHAVHTITLPTAASYICNKVYRIKDESGVALGHPIVVRGQGGETIDGAATQTVSSYECISFYTDGLGRWFQIM